VLGHIPSTPGDALRNNLEKLQWNSQTTVPIPIEKLPLFTSSCPLILGLRRRGRGSQLFWVDDIVYYIPELHLRNFLFYLEGTLYFIMSLVVKERDIMLIP
jgi:hypothetical protein